MGQELTNKIKAALLDYYIFQRSATLACTELWDGFGIADVIALMKNDIIIEVEIKISTSDLRNELKKGKEKYNWNIVQDNSGNNKYEKTNVQLVTKHNFIENKAYSMPNKYYFCVPKYMLNDTIIFAEKLNPKYGVLVFDENSKYIKECISVAKRAYYLHLENNVDMYKYKMIDRLSNDLTKRYRMLYWK